MSGKRVGREAGRVQSRTGGAESERDVLMNALRFEREKNQVLLDEVIVLEDALVNRQIEEFDAVISDETRDFWRELLLSNREKAETALRELVQAKQTGKGDGKRPLHNRATARPVRPGEREGGVGPADDDREYHGFVERFNRG